MSPPSLGPPRILRGAVLALAAVLAGFFVYVVVQRLRFAVDVEWMTGSILDHVERVQRGEPIYAAPSAAWIPFLYPPLYYWVSAAVARFAPVLVACRLVSIASTLGCAALIARLCLRLGATRSWTLAALGCFFGAYAFTGHWYDIERCDALFTAMLLGGAVLLVERRGLGATAIAGAIVGGAFFAKQPALAVLAGGTAGLFATRDARRAIAFGITGSVVVGAGVLALQVQTGGWFAFYCFDMPAAHGLATKLITVFFVHDLSNAFLLTAATVALLAGVGRALATRSPDLTIERIVFASLLAAVLFGSATSRMHLGGWPNVLIPWTSFACVAVAVVASELEGASAPLVWAAALLQLGLFAYDPTEACPDAATVEAAATFATRVHALEERGEVIAVGKGHVTARRHFHAAALVDLVRKGDPVPPDLLAAIRDQRYAAYVFDETGEIAFDYFLGRPGALFEALATSYFVAERIDEGGWKPIIGWPAHPTWVLRPRRQPLAGFDVAQLKRRQAIEMAIAEMRMRASLAGGAIAGDDVEQAARAIDQGSLEAH